MAERRMFAKSIIDTDTFIDMPATARLLYFDLGMRADDDGFVDSSDASLILEYYAYVSTGGTDAADVFFSKPA